MIATPTASLPESNRFTTFIGDPLGFVAGDANLYRYVGNDPVNLIDPDGLEAQGHHYVPKSVTRDLRRLLNTKSARIFENGISGILPFTHGNDTWNGITHSANNEAVKSLLKGYAEALRSKGKGSRLLENQAKDFLNFIATGKVPSEDQILKKVVTEYGDAANVVSKWRKGFHKSIAVALTAQEVARGAGVVLSADELKAIAQKQVNDGIFSPKMGKVFENSKNIRKVESGMTKLGTKGFRKLTGVVAKRFVPILGGFLTAQAAADAYANGSRNGITGVLGAADQAIADMMMADLAEEFVLAPAANGWADFWADLFGLDSPNQRHRQGGFDDSGLPLKK